MKKRKRQKEAQDSASENVKPSSLNLLKEVQSNTFKKGEGKICENDLEINRKRRCKSIDAKNMRVPTSITESVIVQQNVDLQVVTPTENAMLNELIVANLMKYASVKDLARNRLVCRTWNIEAINFIKREHVLEIVDEGTRHSIATFIDSMRHSWVMPFTRFDLRFEKAFPKKLPKSYRTFFFLFGGFINHLSIGFLMDCEVNFSVHILRNVFLMAVPNIVSLAIDLPMSTTSEPGIFLRNQRIKFHRLKSILIQDFVGDITDNFIQRGRERYNDGFMKDLFNAAPNLQKFSLFTDSSLLMTRIVKSLDTLKINHSPLTQLHLDGNVAEEDLNTLSERKFNLRAVRIRCLKPDVTKSTLEHFLEVHRKTLEDLCVGDRCDYGAIGEDNRRFNLYFPRMEKLKVLKIIRKSGLTARLQGKIYLTSGGFSQLPILKSLTFDNDFPEPFLHIEDFFPYCNKKCLTLQELNFSCELMNAEILELIAKDYPEIIKLRITHATSKLVRIICQNMLNIQTLFLYLPDFGRGKGYNIGSLCIQLDVKNCKKICVLRSPKEGYWFTVIFKKPALGILKKLEKLEVETRNLRNCVHDVRVLTKFNELTTLYFNRKLTDKYRRILSYHLPNVRIIDQNY